LLWLRQNLVELVEHLQSDQHQSSLTDLMSSSSSDSVSRIASSLESIYLKSTTDEEEMTDEFSTSSTSITFSRHEENEERLHSSSS
jgi:hypothetical protein